MGRSILQSFGPAGSALDPNIKPTLQTLAGADFGFSDLIAFSHGWCTNGTAAMSDYATAATGVADAFIRTGKPLNALEIGVHWPSTLSEDSGNILADIAQPASFFSRGRMADAVGAHGVYSVLRLFLESRRDAGLSVPRITLIGHSFGCRVCASALQALATDPATASLIVGLSVNLILLQAAFDNDSFEAGQAYGDVLAGFPKLRILATISSEDRALNDGYRLADRLFGDKQPALGAVGLPADSRLIDAANIAVDVGNVPGMPSARTVIANLTELHHFDGYPAPLLAGHHSDIFRPEIYELIAAFIGQ